MRIAPYIRLVLTIAILLAVAPQCAMAVECEPCSRPSCVADDHGAIAQVVKRPTPVGSPRIVRAVAQPASSLHATAKPRVVRREAPPAPPARLRV